MRLFTCLGVNKLGSVLSGPIFSEAADFACLVRDLKWLILSDYLENEIGTFQIPFVDANGTEIETQY